MLKNKNTRKNKNMRKSKRVLGGATNAGENLPQLLNPPKSFCIRKIRAGIWIKCYVKLVDNNLNIYDNERSDVVKYSIPDLVGSNTRLSTEIFIRKRSVLNKLIITDSKNNEGELLPPLELAFETNNNGIGNEDIIYDFKYAIDNISSGKEWNKEIIDNLDNMNKFYTSLIGFRELLNSIYQSLFPDTSSDGLNIIKFLKGGYFGIIVLVLIGGNFKIIKIESIYEYGGKHITIFNRSIEHQNFAGVNVEGRKLEYKEKGEINNYINDLKADASTKFLPYKNITPFLEPTKYHFSHDCFISIMDYLDGITLNEFLRNNIDDKTLVRKILIKLKGEIEKIHNEGIYHCDLSPDNIIIMNSNNSVKLIDFGLSRSHDGSSKPFDEYSVCHNEVGRYPDMGDLFDDDVNPITDDYDKYENLKQQFV